MAFFAKIALALSLVMGSILGLFHHGQKQNDSGSSITSTTIPTGKPAVLPAEADKATYTQIFNESGPVGAPMDSEAAFEPIAKDKNHVYFASSVFTQADPSSFIYMGGLYFKDSRSVYSYARRSDELIVLVNAMTDSFACIGNCTYAKDDAHVYYGLTVVQGADPSTFHTISDPNLFDGAQDKNHIYAQGKIVQESSTPSKISDGHFLNPAGDKSEFVLSGSQIYFVFSTYPSLLEKLLAGANSASFHVLCDAISDSSAFAKDNTRVFFREQQLQDANASTFQPLYDNTGACDDYYGKDNRRVYYAGAIISNFPSTFAVLPYKSTLFSDGQKIFQFGEVLSDDAPHFVLVSSSTDSSVYAQDSKRLYVSSQQSTWIYPYGQ